MSAEHIIANMLRIAKEDLDGARLLAPARNRNAVYLCEQAAEKIIRAVLTSEKKHAGIGHRLDAFVDLVPDENPMKSALRSLEELTAYATTWRYPTSSGRIPQLSSPGDIERFVKNVAAAPELAANGYGVDLGAKGLPASRPGPLR